MFPYLEAAGWSVQFEPFVDEGFFSRFYSGGNRWEKATYLASRSLSRLALALRVADVDAVFVQREASLIGPPYVEGILSAVRGLPLIFDFDDAIWHYDLRRSKHQLAARLLKRPSKCWYTMRKAALVLAGSSFLAERAREVNPSVEVVPTVVSSATWTPLPGRLQGELGGHRIPRIGWVGSHSTAHQLELVLPALRRLRNQGHRFELHVVGADRSFDLDGFALHARSWRLEDELREFQELDIGLAPMRGAPVYQGKCGFKQLQYMSVGVPCVSSWVGGARDFVIDGENALVALDEQDWYTHIKKLLESRELRARLASTGRRLIESRYCSERQGPRLAQLIDNTLRQNHASR
ncbi:MAG: glycosyltransferase family 4 protein [Deltaproteobacteria bacterium]|jgi:glycosyltransferase involved in cell wall biosynthesis|nr:glycosyltransferase family 4 protein [Deltaproteobacteria bacterium]